MCVCVCVCVCVCMYVCICVTITPSSPSYRLSPGPFLRYINKCNSWKCVCPHITISSCIVQNINQYFHFCLCAYRFHFQKFHVVRYIMHNAHISWHCSDLLTLIILVRFLFTLSMFNPLLWLWITTYVSEYTHTHTYVPITMKKKQRSTYRIITYIPSTHS